MLSAGRGGIHGRTYAGNHRQIWPACPVTHPRQKSDVAKIFSFFLKKVGTFRNFFRMYYDDRFATGQPIRAVSVSRTRPDGQIRKNFPKTSLFH